MIKFTTNYILPILEKELIGKIVRIETSTPIYKEYTVEVKKSANVTNKQFNSGDKKYRMLSTKKEKIGMETKIEDSPIKRIWFEDTDDYWVKKLSLRAELENGNIIDLED